MILVRDAGRRLTHPALRWPRALRGKWIALALFAAVLFAYELFDLWELPRATAWLVLGYFATALVVDVLFAGASFCKYVCPVGQFNFAGSLMSPTELQVRDLPTCRSCRTVDCIKGTSGEIEPKRRGCELGIFLPMKVGNLDCTLCLDCVRACPHDNIGLMTRVPGAELLDTRRRSGVGRLALRPDLAALAVIFTFGALLNAFAMTAPVADVERRLSEVMGTRSEAPVLAVVFVAALLVLPVLLVGGASAITRLMSVSASSSIRATAIRYAYALVPLGFGIWAAHYAFHFLTGALTAVPVTQSAAMDLLGWAALGEPRWRWAGIEPGSAFPIQLGLLLLGAAGSMGLAHATSRRDHPGRAVQASAPWIALLTALTATAIWVLAQPMDMRGVSFPG
jgi:ferredoxin